MPPLIELSDIVVSTQDYVILDRVSVAFPEKASTVIMGPSGCGKSTLLKVAAGITVPAAGEVLVGGRSLQRLSERRLLEFRRTSGFMFQDAALWANKTIFENLALPLQFHRPELPAPAVRERVLSDLAGMGLDGSADLRPAQLSMGEAKIVSFLRAVILDPRLLFLDEPTPSIDHLLVEKLLTRIRALKQGGCTIIAVTHDAHLTALIANHLVVLKNGRLLEAGDIASVRQSRNREVTDILSQVLSETATYDADLLDLLGG
jgi:phospholipid/cholesterol/gamma-HCH transport system ATP-binding protein